MLTNLDIYLCHILITTCCFFYPMLVLSQTDVTSTSHLFIYLVWVHRCLKCRLS